MSKIFHFSTVFTRDCFALPVTPAPLHGETFVSMRIIHYYNFFGNAESLARPPDTWNCSLRRRGRRGRNPIEKVGRRGEVPTGVGQGGGAGGEKAMGL